MALCKDDWQLLPHLSHLQTQRICCKDWLPFSLMQCHCLWLHMGKTEGIKFLKLLEDKGAVLQTVKWRPIVNLILSQ